MKTKILVLTSCLLITLSSCISVKLLPDYSEALEKQIIETQKLNEKLYTDLLAKPQDQRSYDSCEKSYLEIESNINSILFQNQSRDKNTDFVAMTKILKEKFNKYKNEHKSKTTPLSDGEINGYIEYINGFWQPLLTAETVLKNAKK